MSTSKFSHPRPVTYSPIGLRAPLPVEDSRGDASQTTEALALDRSTESEPMLGNRLLRLELFLLAAIIGFGYFAWRTLKQESALYEGSLSHDRSLLNLASSVAKGNVKVNGLTKSIEAVTASLAQSSSQIGDFSNQLGQRQNEMQGLYSRLHSVEVAVRKSPQVKPQETDANTALAMGHRPPASQSAPLSDPHIHEFDMSIPMPGGALAHQNSQREMDYWMVPRMQPSGERLVKVMPYGTNSLGIKVHSIDDGMDYILTPQGSWMETIETH